MNKEGLGETVAPGPALSVWVVEDNAAYRSSLARVLERALDHVRLQVFADCESALSSLTPALAPKVLLLDLGLPGMSGLEGLVRFKAVAPETRIIVLTSFEDHERIFKAICAGASGYLLKDADLTMIIGAVREVMAGGAPMSPQVASIVLTMFAQLGSSKQAKPEYGLSPRETETLEGMVEGLTAKEIAARMGVSYHTVDTYVRSIYEKLHVQSRGGAVAKAVREGLL